MPRLPLSTLRHSSDAPYSANFDPYSTLDDQPISPMLPSEKASPVVLSPLRRQVSVRGPVIDPTLGLRGIFFDRQLVGALFMLVPLVIAILAAIGHHLLYAHLHGLDTGSSTNLVIGGTTLSQNWAVSVGTAFAFLFKAASAAAVAGAFWQRVWRVARKSHISVEGYDAIFGILHSPIPFLRSILWSTALSLALISSLSWLIPIATIFTPGSIKTVIKQSSNTTSCRIPSPGRFRFGTTELVDQRDIVLHDSAGAYISPSISASNLFHRTFVGKAVVPWSSPCSSAEHCEYSTSFVGLGVDCQKDVFDPQDLIAHSAYTFYNSRTTITLKNPADEEVQSTLVDGAYINISSPVNVSEADTSAQAPWAQHGLEMAWMVIPHPPETTTASYSSIRCVPTNVTYTVSFVEDFGNQIASLVSQHRNQLIVGAGFTNDLTKKSADRLSDPLAGMFDALSSEFTGRIFRVPTAGLGALTTFQAATNLAYNNDFVQIRGQSDITFGNFEHLIPELAFNMSLSVFSSGFSTTDGDCTSTRTHQVYSYSPRTLWLSYGLTLAFILPVLVVGLLSLRENGRAAPGVNTFSLLLEATRGPTLDRLFEEEKDNDERNGVVGSSEKSTELRRRVYKSVLRYGARESGEHGTFEVVDQGRFERRTQDLVPELLA